MDVKLCSGEGRGCICCSLHFPINKGAQSRLQSLTGLDRTRGQLIRVGCTPAKQFKSTPYVDILIWRDI